MIINIGIWWNGQLSLLIVVLDLSWPRGIDSLWNTSLNVGSFVVDCQGLDLVIIR